MSFHKPDITFGTDVADSLLTHAGMTSETLSRLRAVPQAETPLKSLSLKSALVPGPSQAALGLGDQDTALLISSLDKKSTLSNNVAALPSWAANAQRSPLPAGKKLGREDGNGFV